MDSLGIELKEGSWSLVHIRSTLFGIKPAGHAVLTGANDEERLVELKEYIRGHGIQNPRIALGVNGGATVSRVLELPAPDASSLDGIMKFELEKHFPFGLEDISYGYQVLKREKNIFEVFVASATKKSIEKTVSMFSSAGLKPMVAGGWQEAVLNALFHLKKLSPEKNVVAVLFDGASLSIEIISGMSPVFFKRCKVESRNAVDLGQTVRTELGLALSSAGIAGGRLDEVVVMGDPALCDSLSVDIADYTGARICALTLGDENMPPSAVSAFGLALVAAGKAKLNINLASELSDEEGYGSRARTFKLVAFVALLAVTIGASYLLRDMVAIKRLEAAVSEARAEKEKVETLIGSVKAAEARTTALDAIKGSYPVTPLDILKELTELLPNDTWLTGFEYSNEAAVIEGFSERSSSLILKMEKSVHLKDVELTGPVTKRSNGKEHFRLKFTVPGVVRAAVGEKG